VSAFCPSFSPQARVFPRSPRAISPLSTAFTPNRSLTPLSTAFTQTDGGVAYLWDSLAACRLFTSHRPAPFRTGSRVTSHAFSIACRLLNSLASLLQLLSFVFSTLQPLVCKIPGVGYPERFYGHPCGVIQSFDSAAQKPRGHAGACPLHNSDPLRVDYAPALFEKLDTASASVLYTSKTVRSLVICRTS
jgi:hypothetical protein